MGIMEELLEDLPRSHAHVPSTQAPWPEQPDGHARREQSRPTRPATHSQPAGPVARIHSGSESLRRRAVAPTTAAAPATQRPKGAEQLFGHAPTSQPAPLKPGAQLHLPVAVSQRPRAEQSSGQRSRSTGSTGSGRWRKQSSPM